MNNAMTARANEPASAADVPVRRASIQKSNPKSTGSEDATTANAAFEQEITQATRANDVQRQTQTVEKCAGKKTGGKSDTDTEEKDGTSASDATAGDATDRPAVATDAIGVTWAGQISQSLWGQIPVQTAGTTGAPIQTLQEKSASALSSARALMISPDMPVDDTTDQTVETDTTVVVNAKEAHWMFGAPTGQDNVALPTATATTSTTTGSVESVLASILGGDAGKKAITSAANDTGETSKKSGSDVTTSATQKSSSPQQPIAAVTQLQDQTSGSGSGDPPPARDQTFKPAEKTSLPLNAGVQSAEPISSNNDASPTPGAMVVQQVRTGIVDAMRNDAPATPQSSASAPASAYAPDRPLAAGQVLRTIDLTLEPPDLGAVKLRLSLKSNVLAIDAETSKASTAKLLNDDRDTLEKSLRTAGYDVSAIRVTDASSTSGAMLGSGSSFQDGNQARTAYANRDQSDLQRRSGDNPQQNDRRSPGEQRQNRPSSSDATPARSGNAVYI